MSNQLAIRVNFLHIWFLKKLPYFLKNHPNSHIRSASAYTNFSKHFKIGASSTNVGMPNQLGFKINLDKNKIKINKIIFRLNRCNKKNKKKSWCQKFKQFYLHLCYWIFFGKMNGNREHSFSIRSVRWTYYNGLPDKYVITIDRAFEQKKRICIRKNKREETINNKRYTNLR